MKLKTGKQQRKINKPKAGSLKKINKNGKFVGRLSKGKERRCQVLISEIKEGS